MRVYIAILLLSVSPFLHGTAAAHENVLSIDEFNAMFAVRL